MNCSAHGCTNCKKKNPELSFFKLPSDPVIAGIWRRNCQISDKFKQIRLCSEHFEEKYFDYSHYLKIRLLPASKFLVKHKLVPGAIPTIFTRTTKSCDDPTVSDYPTSDGLSLVDDVDSNNDHLRNTTMVDCATLSTYKNSDFQLSTNVTIKEEASSSTVYVILSPVEEEQKYPDRVCPFFKNGYFSKKDRLQNKYVQTDISFNHKSSEHRKRGMVEESNDSVPSKRSLEFDSSIEDDISQSDTNFYCDIYREG